MEIRIKLIAMGLMLVMLQEPVSAGSFAGRFGAVLGRVAKGRLTTSRVLMAAGVAGVGASTVANQSIVSGSGASQDGADASVQSDYSKVREQFKSRLYERQIGLMGQKEYEDFIEPYMKKAEQQLQIPGHYAKQGYVENSSLPLCEDYFKHLLNYNVACFHHHVRPNPTRTLKLVAASGRLEGIINRIKEANIVKDLDAEKEFKKTSELFKEANVEYYNKLGYCTQLALWLWS